MLFCLKHPCAFLFKRQKMLTVYFSNGKSYMLYTNIKHIYIYKLSLRYAILKERVYMLFVLYVYFSINSFLAYFEYE